LRLSCYPENKQKPAAAVKRQPAKPDWKVPLRVHYKVILIIIIIIMIIGKENLFV